MIEFLYDGARRRPGWICDAEGGPPATAPMVLLNPPRTSAAKLMIMIVVMTV
ncbi:MAG: hypothetical protein R2717_00605 [Schumannella sp.]